MLFNSASCNAKFLSASNDLTVGDDNYLIHFCFSLIGELKLLFSSIISDIDKFFFDIISEFINGPFFGY
jgi:hypothetical protein